MSMLLIAFGFCVLFVCRLFHWEINRYSNALVLGASFFVYRSLWLIYINECKRLFCCAVFNSNSKCSYQFALNSKFVQSFPLIWTKNIKLKFNRKRKLNERWYGNKKIQIEYKLNKYNGKNTLIYLEIPWKMINMLILFLSW